MMTYDYVRAVQEHRFGKYMSRETRARRNRDHHGLRELLRALAGRLADLGIRGRDGEFHPASPAY